MLRAMTKRWLPIAGLLAGLGCNQAAEPVTPAPVVAPSPAPDVTSPPAPATTPSLCEEIAAVLEASKSSYAGLALEDKPVKRDKDTAGFQARQPLHGAASCAVYGEPDPSYFCELGPASAPAESGAVLKVWESKLAACPALAPPFKMRTLGEHGKVWSDDKSKGERSVSLAFSGDDARPRPVLVVRLYK